tara:strand:- start:50 stop:511 length:462 start_codon:yes stop_codon:yes gene_type:complete
LIKDFINLTYKSALIDFIFSPLAIKIFYKNNKFNFKKKIYEDHIDDIKKIFDYANEKNVDIIFLIMPVLINNDTFESSTKTYINFLRTNFYKICNKNDLLMDISNNIKKNLKPVQWTVNKFDAHASFKVNDLIATELYEIIHKKNKTNYMSCK